MGVSDPLLISINHHQPMGVPSRGLMGTAARFSWAPVSVSRPARESALFCSVIGHDSLLVCLASVCRHRPFLTVPVPASASLETTVRPPHWCHHCGTACFVMLVFHPTVCPEAHCWLRIPQPPPPHYSLHLLSSTPVVAAGDNFRWGDDVQTVRPALIFRAALWCACACSGASALMWTAADFIGNSPGRSTGSQLKSILQGHATRYR